jgi:hypothetical protein
LNFDQDAAYPYDFRDLPHPYKNRNISVDTATGYGLDDRGSNPNMGKIFISPTTSRPTFGAHTASYPMGTFFPGGKAAEA